MKKYFSICILTLLVVSLMCGSAFAGTIVLKGAAALKVAKELKGTDGYLAEIGDRVASYTPAEIPLGSLVDPVINFSVGTGVISVGASVVPQLCSTIIGTTGGTIIANYATGSGTAKLTFQPITGAGRAILNGVPYYFGKDDCTSALGAADITATFLLAETSVLGTITAGSGQDQVVRDTATATLMSSAGWQWSATVTTLADQKISPTSYFKTFVSGGLTDTIAVTIANARTDFDKSTADNASDVATLKFNLTNVSGLIASSVTITDWTCDLDLDTKIATCTKTGILPSSASTLVTATFTVNGTDVLVERTFTVDAEISFATGSYQPRTGTDALLSAATAGKWIYDGMTIYVPLVRTGNGFETYIKLQSSDTTAGTNGIKALILTSDGTFETVDVGTIVAGVPYTITGDQLKSLLVTGTVDGVAGFAVKLNVFTADKALYGYANIIDASGVAKRVPLSQVDGIGGQGAY